LQNECGFLSGVPGVYCEVECSVWCSSKDCGICGLGITVFPTGVDVRTDFCESKEVSCTVSSSAASNGFLVSVLNWISPDDSSCCRWSGVLKMSGPPVFSVPHFVVWWSCSFFHVLTTYCTASCTYYDVRFNSLLFIMFR
jgi:hypothetical protein